MAALYVIRQQMSEQEIDAILGKVIGTRPGSTSLELLLSKN